MPAACTLLLLLGLGLVPVPPAGSLPLASPPRLPPPPPPPPPSQSRLGRPSSLSAAGPAGSPGECPAVGMGTRTRTRHFVPWGGGGSAWCGSLVAWDPAHSPQHRDRGLLSIPTSPRADSAQKCNTPPQFLSLFNLARLIVLLQLRWVKVWDGNGGWESENAL